MKEIGLSTIDRATMACALAMLEATMREHAEELSSDHILAFIVGLASIEKIRKAFDLKEVEDQMEELGLQLGIE